MTLTNVRPFAELCAGDLMSHHVVMIPKEMSIQGAARLLSRAQVSGAPVVDEQGRCVGVISSTDFVHWVEGETKPHPSDSASKCMCSAWQILEEEKLPECSVQTLMTKDPVTVTPNARIGVLAKTMLNAHIHRVVVVDERAQPIGIVSTTDILAAVARANHDEP